MTRGIGTSINQSFCCAGFDTWGAKASQEPIVTRGIGKPINQSFCCAGFITWGAKASQDLIVTRGIGKPIHQSFFLNRRRHMGRQSEPGTNCDTRHWDANQSIFLLCRLRHVGRQGEPGPNCDTRQIIPPREDEEEAGLLPRRPHQHRHRQHQV